MTTTSQQPETAVSHETYVEVQRFYTRQMRLLDTAATREWADTFTEDGVFAANGLHKSVRGRENIATAAAGAARQRVAAGIVHRHWIGMLSVDRSGSDELTATSYALVIEVQQGGGGEGKVHRSTVCVDVLVPAPGGGWAVRDRMVTRDDLTGPAAPEPAG
jgi:hypothetical protein